MDIFEERCYLFNRQLMYFLGLWPYEKSKIKRNFRIVIVSFFIFVATYSQGHLLFLFDTNLETIIDVMHTLIPCLCYAVCYYGYLFNFDNMKKVCDCIKCDWQELTDSQDLLIMKKYANESRLVTIVFAIVFYSYAIFLLSPTILRIFLYVINKRNDFPYTLPIKCCINTTTGVIFSSVFLVEIVTLFFIVTIGITSYATYILFVQHACTLFSIITNRINRPFEQNDDILLPDKINDQYFWLKDITKRYIYAIHFVDLINSLSEKVYVIEMLLALLFIGIDFLHMFQISTMMENISGSLIYFVYIPGSILILYLQCYVGQRLLNHSAEILKASSCIPFYKTSVKCQKGIIMLILRSTKPSKLSIGGLFTCSHYFFSELMQKSLSYAMVCYAMR